jgi:hypothetical protein
MIQSDPCMVLLKETLPDYYHQTLFKIVKKLLLSKSKQGSVNSTSAASKNEIESSITKKNIGPSFAWDGVMMLGTTIGKGNPTPKIEQIKTKSVASSENHSITNSAQSTII